MTLYRRPLRDGLRFRNVVRTDEHRTVKANDDGTFDVLDQYGNRIFVSLTEQQFYVLYDGPDWHWITPSDEPEPAPERPEFQEGDRFQIDESKLTLVQRSSCWDVVWDGGHIGRYHEDDLRLFTRLPAEPEPTRIVVAEGDRVAVDPYGRRWVLEVGQ